MVADDVIDGISRKVRFLLTTSMVCFLTYCTPAEELTIVATERQVNGNLPPDATRGTDNEGDGNAFRLLRVGCRGFHDG